LIFIPFLFGLWVILAAIISRGSLQFKKVIIFPLVGFADQSAA
jgi:hypothetical protein